MISSRNVSNVQELTGTTVNVSTHYYAIRFDNGAAGAAMPNPRTYYVAVDSNRDPFTGRSRAGRYVLQSWVNDVLPPVILPVSRRVSAGRPTLVARVVDVGRTMFDPGSGVDPYSLVIGYRRALVGAAAYDPISGLAVFPLPRQAPVLRPGRQRLLIGASDNQEAKNVNTASEELIPNSSVRAVQLRVVSAPTVTWLAPAARECARGPERLVVAADSPTRVRSVRFLDGRQTIAVVRRGTAGLYATTWRTGREPRGRHVLRAVVVDAKSRRASALRNVRVCR